MTAREEENIEMSFISGAFIAFLSIGLVIYYLCPKRVQWVVLLGLSLVFYCWGGMTQLAYVLFTAMTIWGGAQILERMESAAKEELREKKALLSAQEKKALKAAVKRRKQYVFWGVLLVNLGILAVIKYYNFTAELILSAMGRGDADFRKVSFLVPLGISFYTFQVVSYLIDVYNGKYAAEKNPARFLLFVSFFPQVVQGPIGRYDKLGVQLREEHAFAYRNLWRGVVLMLWGYLMKLGIADRLGRIVNEIFVGYEKYGGCIAMIGVLFYAVQLYMDFAGGINIVTGAAEMFGIHLAPNFKRPYFATSMGDFWHRWHISLGDWMRDYLFYPLAMSKPMMALSKKLKKKSLYLSRTLPAVVGNIVVFFVVGVWHGAQMSYIIWGLYNGIVLALSAVFAPAFKAFNAKYPKLTASPVWHVFRVIRTFVVVCIGYYFDRAPTVIGALKMISRSIRYPMPYQFIDGAWYELNPQRELGIWMIGLMLIVFAVSLFQERMGSVRDWMEKKPAWVRWALAYGLMFLLIACAKVDVVDAEGFLYAAF